MFDVVAKGAHYTHRILGYIFITLDRHHSHRHFVQKHPLSPSRTGFDRDGLSVNHTNNPWLSILRSGRIGRYDHVYFIWNHRPDDIVCHHLLHNGICSKISAVNTPEQLSSGKLDMRGGHNVFIQHYYRLPATFIIKFHFDWICVYTLYDMVYRMVRKRGGI